MTGRKIIDEFTNRTDLTASQKKYRRRRKKEGLDVSKIRGTRFNRIEDEFSDIENYAYRYYLRNKEKCDAQARQFAIDHPERSKEIKQKSHKKNYDPAVGVLNGIRLRCIKRSIPFDLEYEDILPPSHCPILGIELQRGTGKSEDNSPSVDRLIPELGYVKSNIRVISNKANRLKSNASIEELEKVLAYMKREITPNE